MPTNYHFRPRAPQKGSRTLSSAYLTPPLVPRYGFFLGRRPLESGATPEFFSPCTREFSTLRQPPVPTPSLSSAPNDDLLSPVFRLTFVVADGWRGDVTVDAVLLLVVAGVATPGTPCPSAPTDLKGFSSCSADLSTAPRS